MSIYFLWIDLETTGLDPDSDLILEMAWTITDSEFNTIIPPRTHIITPDNWADFADKWRNADPFVKDMHTNNGLYEVLTETGPHSNLDRAYIALEEDLKSLPSSAEVHLAGRSVAFDKSFLLANGFNVLFDRISGPLISHRFFDVRTLKTYFSLIGVGIRYTEPGNAHRALVDIMSDIDFARSSRELGQMVFPHPPVEAVDA